MKQLAVKQEPQLLSSVALTGGECVVQETPGNPSLDELHAEDVARESVKEEEVDDSMEDAKKVADWLCRPCDQVLALISFCNFHYHGHSSQCKCDLRLILKYAMVASLRCCSATDASLAAGGQVPC